MDAILQDIRYALRCFRLSPGFALLVIASLALGTGANSAIFQLLDGVCLRSLPVAEPQELVELRLDDMTHARGNWLRDAALTNPLWEQIRDNQHAFSGAFAWADEPLQTSANGESHEIAGLWVSGNFFRVLGVQPQLGRVFTPSDDTRGCDVTPGAVISYGFWQREFGGDPAVVGKSVLMGRARLQVIGVTPRRFFGLEVGRTFDIALPICSEPAIHSVVGNSRGRLDSGITWWLTVMGRLRPGVSAEQASALFRLNSPAIFKATLPAGYPSESVAPYLAMKLLPITAAYGVSHLRDQYSRPLTVILATAALVLLITCANLANLLLARANARQREMAVRLAVGATRARLARQLATEALLLAFAGALLGLLLSQALSRLLLSLLITENDPVFLYLAQDWRTFAFAAALSVLTCVGFASFPLLRAVQTQPGEVLRSGTRSVPARRETVRRGLVACQIAVSLALLVGTFLFSQSLRNVLTIDPGFQQHGMFIADIGFSNLNLSPGRIPLFRRDLLQRLRAVPLVTGAAETSTVPLTGGNWNNRVWMDDSDISHARVSMRTAIGTGYFRTLQTPLLAGRDFDERDLTLKSKVAVVNEEFAHRFAAGPNAVGRRFWVESTPYEPQTAFEIVGVVKNTKYRDLLENFQPGMFLPLSQAALERPDSRILIRSSAHPDLLFALLRKSLAQVNPGLQYSFHVLDTKVRESLVRERLMAALSGGFGILALVLTAVGLYGVISYTVARRIPEIGLRMALGATRSSVVSQVLREAVAVLGAGLAAGLLLAFVAGRSVAALLFGLEASDPLTLLVASIVLVIVTLGASYLPAWRASNVNPAIALREE